MRKRSSCQVSFTLFESPNMSTATLTDEAIEQRFQEQWSHVMGGLDRAVAWVKANKENLRDGFFFHFSLDQKHGIEISLGCIFNDDEKKTAAIRNLFRGKKVQRTLRDNHDESFILKDADLQLTFRWSIWHSKPDLKFETQEVVI